jgi:hypothetical protein
MLNGLESIQYAEPTAAPVTWGAILLGVGSAALTSVIGPYVKRLFVSKSKQQDTPLKIVEQSTNVMKIMELRPWSRTPRSHWQLSAKTCRDLSRALRCWNMQW